MNNDNLIEKKTVKKVLNNLKIFDKKLFLITLNSTARTAEDAANSLNVEVGSIVKSLLFKSVNNNLFYLCLVSGDKLISLEKFSSFLGHQIFKASAKEVKEQTGFSIGGVPPVAHAFPPNKIYIDINLQRFKKIYAAAGHPYVVFGIDFEQLIKITKGIKLDFVE